MNRGADAAPYVFRTINEYKAWRKDISGKVGFVATLGALHEGHFALINRAKQLSDHVVVSIFVNPLQFGPKEDFSIYPRPFESDLDHCTRLKVDVIFNPSVEEMYPQGKDFCTRVVPPLNLADVLEGSFRPGFFTGMATVVAKLFLIVEAHITVFGEKDYQQLLVVKKMVQDLNIPIVVYSLPTERIPDSFALSSRNAYLTDDQRKIAPKIYEILKATADSIRSNPSALKEAIKLGKRQFSDLGTIDLQYLEARDAETFEEIANFKGKAVLLVAAKIGNVRLIDNIILD